MSKRPIFIAFAAAALISSAASAQLLGGDGPVARITGGLLGGGGVTGGARETISGLGSTVGSTVDGTVSGLGGGIRGVGGTIGGIGGTLGNIGSGVERGATGVLGNLNNFSGGLAGQEMIALYQPMVMLEDVYRPEFTQTEPGLLAQIRRMRHEMLIRANRNVLDRDAAGQPVRRGEIIAIDPQPAALTSAIRAGFRVVGDERPAGLGLRVLTLACPKGVNVRDGLKLARRAAPGLHVDYNHIYEPAGGALLPSAGVRLATHSVVRPGTRLAMIDGGVASHPSLSRASVEQRGFAGPAQPTGHGTAVGSLLVGTQGPFKGAARGAQLFVGDVYGGNPAAGSATIIVRALAWAASKQPKVINMSLVGPENRMLARAIAALQARGIGIVAPVGNDGPAAPLQFPASYPGVIGVTGVDGQDRALREAGRAADLDFAAPGADLVAASPGSGYTPVRGTSFAAPFVAARLAATGSSASLAAEATPGKGKVGRGILCRSCRVTPKMVGIQIRK